MSFGFAIGDFVALGRLAWGLYKQCKGASAEFAEVCHEVLSIHTALRELEDEAQNEDSILNRAGKGRQKELNNILQNCTEVLGQLEMLVTRYRSLGTSQRKVWDRIKFGDEGIQVIRNKLVLHTSTLTLFLTSLGTGSLGRIEKKLDDIAAEIRAGHHELSVITAVNDELGPSQSEAWTFLFRELAEDFSVQEVEAFKGEIQAYIKQLVDRGALEEHGSSPFSTKNAEDLLTPRLSPSPSPVVESSGASPAPIDWRNRWWPPKPTATSDSDSEGTDRVVRPPPNRLQPDKRATSTQTRRSSTWKRTEDRELEIAKSTLNSSTVPSGLTDNILLRPIEDRGDESRRWGESCKIGIEIGNDCCRVAAYDFVREEAVSLSDDFGCTEIPTCIAFTRDKILVGHAARNQATSNLENTFLGFTCLLEELNTDWSSKTRLDYQKFQCSSLRQRGQDLVVYVPCRRRHYTLVELTANLLSYCRQLAEARCSSAALHVCITTSSTWGISTFRTLAEAAEVSGIVSPAIVSYGIAFGLNYATRKQIWTRQDELSSMIVNMDSRGCSMFQIVVVSDAEGRPQISLMGCRMLQYGFSIDEVTASSLIPEALPSKHYIKKIGMQMQDARGNFLRGGERFFDFPRLGDVEDFVPVPPRVDMCSIDENYLKNLLDHLQYCWYAARPVDSCILTGELALLESVQSTFNQHLFSNLDPACILGVPSPDDPFNASKGAAELDLHTVDVDEFLPYCLELQTLSQDHQTHFLVLADYIKRGQHRASWSNLMHLVPQSTKQGGLYLKVVETDRKSKALTRGVLFEAAIKIAMVSSRYSLAVSVDVDFNIGFKLQCEDGVQDDGVLAEVHCSNSRIVDLRRGNFVVVTERIRKEWLMKPLGEEIAPSPTFKADGKNIKPPGRDRGHKRDVKSKRDSRTETNKSRQPKPTAMWKIMGLV
ncbi:hypothetical protein EPUS_05446 [Endocarpon pusillum Z07020]|uniref:Fungal N-terminal domain-containing protein n=1 Tax=Endocarpon pusillum (strain Z07020 / HMAS-L-300199) TaxID=1263415 RepID=U1FYA7_ENDPU|nr:uncharacterized protein EPUS_05446 [Endocarpon pusillum Z07020]ERF69902.1 hypothetical protein EPUS_05446 [Endocarpon pusillum Z07020]